MTPREIIESTFRMVRTEMLPYWLPIEGDVQQRLDKYLGSPRWRERIIPYLMGEHAVGSHGMTEIGGGLHRDPFGSILSWKGIMHLEQAPLPEADLSKWRWPDPDSLADWDTLAKQYRAADKSFRLCGMAFGFFERSWLLRGFEPILMDMVESPQFVHDLLDGYLELRLKVIDRIIERIPVEGIFDGGDDCDQRGPTMGLERWREFIKPRLAALIAHVHRKGLPVVAHMCGNVMPLVDDLLEIRLDALESLQPEAMDVFELRHKTSGRMVLIGGLGVQSTLPLGTPTQVRQKAMELKQRLGGAGGYILAPAKPLMSDVPVENALALFEVACGEKLA